MKRLTILWWLATLTTCLAAPRAQQWRKERIADAGIQVDAPGRLERLPMQLGEEAVYHKARFRPKDEADFVRGQYYWYCDVYQFSKDAKPDVDLPADMAAEDKERLLKMLESSGFKPPKSFQEWLEKQQKDGGNRITVESDGKPKKGRSGKLDYAHWVWKDPSGFGPCGVVYCEAAVFTLGEREVALVIQMPLETEKPGKPKSKWKNIVDRMIASGETCEADENSNDGGKRDQYADEPWKKEALARAKANIDGLKGWDYFTQPNYIVLYSWDFERPDERSKSKKDAEYYASRLEKMRELYLGSYPLDETGTKAVFPDPKSIPTIGAPITGAPEKKTEEEMAEEAEREEARKAQLGQKRYSVFRLCATYEQFQKYGESPPGVVGWFSPRSKELVVFLGGDKMMGQGATETVTYHEGWHQYADFYFDHPMSEKHDSLHRWFDEGHGDYFGGYRWGVNGWKYTGSKMRYDDCKNMVRVGDYVPLKEIVHWDRRRFYLERAPYYYAQAFSMIDFFRRGEKSPHWKPQYGEILDMYRKVMLVRGDSKMASDIAFRDFKEEDWKALEEAWKAWVSGPQFLSGK